MGIFNQPLPYMATALLVACVGIYAWKQPHRPGTYYFGWLIGIWMILAATAGFSTIVQSVPISYVLWLVQSICALSVAPLALLFSLQYTGNETWLARRSSVVLLFLPTFIFVLLAIILPSSALVTIHLHSDIVEIQLNDMIQWPAVAWSTAIWLINLILLFKYLMDAPAFRTPIGLILLGQIFPPVTYAVMNWRQNNVSSIQAMIVFSGFTALTYFICLYFFQILQGNPVVLHTAMNQMPYGKIVLDTSNRLVDFNLAAQKLPGLPGKMETWKPASLVLGIWWKQISTMIGSEIVTKELIHQTDAGPMYFLVKSIPLLQSSGWRIGHAFVFEETTQLRKAQRLQAQSMWAQATLQEREQLAGELHDGLSQNLAYLNVQAQAADLYLKEGMNQAAQDCLARLILASDEIQVETREFINSLLVASPSVENFSEAMYNLLADFRRQTGLTVQLKMGEDHTSASDEFTYESTRIPPPAAGQLVRITQEALSNVRKHANGISLVIVQFTASHGQGYLVIEDDGEGFDPSHASNDSLHFGLRVMRQRAQRMGGQLYIDSKPGQGTRINVCVPLADGYEKEL